MTEQSRGAQPAAASAGTPGGRSPSGATSPGSRPEDTVAAPQVDPDEQDGTQVPGQEPGGLVSPVPSPGDVPGAAAPEVSAAQAPDPQDGISQGDKGPGSDSSTASPGAYVALAPPGHPDGEVDTRAR